MKTKLKLQITVVITLMVLPLIDVLRRVIQVNNNDNITFLICYLIVSAIMLILLFPVLMVLLDKAAKQIAEVEFKQWENDNYSK